MMDRPNARELWILEALGEFELFIIDAWRFVGIIVNLSQMVDACAYRIGRAVDQVI